METRPLCGEAKALPDAGEHCQGVEVHLRYPLLLLQCRKVLTLEEIPQELALVVVQYHNLFLDLVELDHFLHPDLTFLLVCPAERLLLLTSPRILLLASVHPVHLGLRPREQVIEEGE